MSQMKQETGIAEKAKAINNITEGATEAVREKPAAEKGDSPNDCLAEDYDEENGISLEMQVGKWDIFRFMLRHTYCSVSGMIGLLLSIICLVRGINELISGTGNSMTAIFLFVGVWFIVVYPLSLLGKAAMQVKTTPSLQKPITYTFTKVGMLQEQGEVKTGCKWNMITKTVFMKRIWVLYAGRVRANVIPVAQLGEHAEELKALIKENTGKKKRKK